MAAEPEPGITFPDVVGGDSEPSPRILFLLCSPLAARDLRPQHAEVGVGVSFWVSTGPGPVSPTPLVLRN